MTKRVCEHCGGSIEGRRRDARFCSDACRAADWDEKHPGAALQRLQRHERARSRPSRKRPFRAQIEVYRSDFQASGFISPSLIRKIHAAKARLDREESR